MQIMWSGKRADCSPEPFPLQSVTLIQAIHKLGIDPTFGAERLLAPKVVEN
jgi:hypothetical protein